MTDYIDREAFLADKVFLVAGTLDDYDQGYMDGVDAVEEAAKEFPAADVRPVVLCKQCSLWCKDESKLKKTAVCSHWSNLEDAAYIYTYENDFCSYGISEVEE